MRKHLNTNKKGNLQGWAQTGIFIVGALMVWAVSAITLNAFQTSQVDGGVACGTNSTGGSAGTILYTGCNEAYNITGSGLTFLGNASAQLGTAGTILGVGLLLVIIGVIGVGGYMAYQKTR